MTDLISVVLWMAVFSLVLAFTVFVVSKIVEHRNPPIGKFLAIDGIRLHYFEQWKVVSEPLCNCAGAEHCAHGEADIEPGYGSLQMPIFILAGGEDRLVGPWHSEKLHGEVHASQLQIVPGVGHMVQHSAPDQVASIIARAM
jgi:pimeloyl-ACP methyl ester carboxylesterase